LEALIDQLTHVKNRSGKRNTDDDFLYHKVSKLTLPTT
jgi:hypothetical protein